MMKSMLARDLDEKHQGNAMRRYVRIIFAALAVCLLVTSAAQAQMYQGSAGWNGGVLMSTSLNDGASASELVDMKPDLTWLASFHYDRWFGGGSFGIRARGGFSMPTLPWTQGDREIRLLMGDLGLLLRPVAPAPDKTALPFISAGIGLINWGLGDGPPATYESGGVAYDGSQAVDFVATAGLGVDILSPWQWGEGSLMIRVEARDHIQFSSPFDPLDAEAGDLGMIHNFGFVVGFHTGIGLLPGG